MNLGMLSALFGKNALLTLFKSLGAAEIGKELHHVHVTPEGCKEALAPKLQAAADAAKAGDWNGTADALASCLAEIK